MQMSCCSPPPFPQYALLLQLVSQILYSVQILDFWRTYAERGGGVCGRDNAAVCVSLRLEPRSLNALISSAAPYAFNSRDCMIFTLHDLTDFYVERVTAHRIQINDNSCFHNLWPNSKTKLTLKHLWEQDGPLVFQGPYTACVFCV